MTPLNQRQQQVLAVFRAFPRPHTPQEITQRLRYFGYQAICGELRLLQAQGLIQKVSRGRYRASVP